MGEPRQRLVLPGKRFSFFAFFCPPTSAFKYNNLSLEVVSDLLSLDSFSTYNWTSFICHLVWVIGMFLLLYVCFPDRLKTSPAAKPTSSQWKRNLENMLPIWGILSKISSEQGTHFTGKIILALTKTLRIS